MDATQGRVDMQHKTGWSKATVLVAGRDGTTRKVKGYKRSVRPLGKRACSS
jgi:hypothetical protein